MWYFMHRRTIASIYSTICKVFPSVVLALVVIYIVRMTRTTLQSEKTALVHHKEPMVSSGGFTDFIIAYLASKMHIVDTGTGPDKTLSPTLNLLILSPETQFICALLYPGSHWGLSSSADSHFKPQRPQKDFANDNLQKNLIRRNIAEISTLNVVTFSETELDGCEGGSITPNYSRVKPDHKFTPNWDSLKYRSIRGGLLDIYDLDMYFDVAIIGSGGSDQCGLQCVQYVLSNMLHENGVIFVETSETSNGILDSESKLKINTVPGGKVYSLAI